MKINIFDSVEFESISSEEYVAIAVGSTKVYKNFPLFFRKTNEFQCFRELESSFTNCESNLEAYEYSRNVITNLCMCSEITPKSATQIRLIVLREDWNNNDILLQQDNIFIRYHWHTTA